MGLSEAFVYFMTVRNGIAWFGSLVMFIFLSYTYYQILFPMFDILTSDAGMEIIKTEIGESVAWLLDSLRPVEFRVALFGFMMNTSGGLTVFRR